MSPVKRIDRLEELAFRIAEEWRSGKWPDLIDDGGGSEWKATWVALVRELRFRCPGFSKDEYDAALDKGFTDSR